MNNLPLKLFFPLLLIFASSCANLSTPKGSSSPESSSSPDVSPQTAESENKNTPVIEVEINSLTSFETIPTYAGEQSSNHLSDQPMESVATQKVTTNDSAAITNVQESDFWHRLRNSFSLENDFDTSPAIRKFERWFANNPEYFDRLSERAFWFIPYVLQEVEKRGMPAEVALLPAVESAFRPDAVSKSNAVGLWQMISATGQRFGLRQDWWMDGRRDVVQSTRAALDYLDYLHAEFSGDWELALAGYNAGEGTIRKAVKRNLTANKSVRYSALKLRKETVEYIPKLFAIRNIISNPEKYGITLRQIPDQQTLAVIDARAQTDLIVAASLAPISAQQLQYLNMGYKRGVTPPNGPHKIVVPIEQAEVMLTALNKLSYQQRLRWARHQVRKGEYLGRIARKHGVSVESIIQANQLTSNLIQPGQELKIPISTGNYQFAKITSSDIKIRDGDKIYTVKSGDTLWRISQHIGTTLPELLRWNGMSKGSLLHPGQQLIVGRST